jgi:hypothetical protein
METVIERQRRQHEECERLENALTDELLLKKQTVCSHVLLEYIYKLKSWFTL